MSKQCSYKDLVVYGTSNQICSVTEDFEIGVVIEDTGLDNIEYVECNACGESFQGLENAKEHIDEQSPKLAVDTDVKSTNPEGEQEQ